MLKLRYNHKNVQGTVLILLVLQSSTFIKSDSKLNDNVSHIEFLKFLN